MQTLWLIALMLQPTRHVDDSPLRANLIQIRSSREILSFEGQGIGNLWDGLQRRGFRFDYSHCPRIDATGPVPSQGYPARWKALGSRLELVSPKGFILCTLNVKVLDVYYEVDGDGKVNTYPFGVGHQ